MKEPQDRTRKGGQELRREEGQHGGRETGHECQLVVEVGGHYQVPDLHP